MKITRLLAFRLFVIILSVLLVGTFLVTTFVMDRVSQAHMDAAYGCAARMSDIIHRSLHYSMLLNRREDIRQIITTVGSEPGIEAIRMYNKEGMITFSTDDAEVGTLVDMTSDACSACHAEDQTRSLLSPDELTRSYTTAAGERVLGKITPIFNTEGCSTADCHAHSSSQVVLGVLDVLIPLREHEELILQMTRLQYLSGGLLVVTVAVLIGLFIWRLVNIPVRQLIVGTQEIIRGNLNHRIAVRTTDEIGMLAASFNRMTDELERAQKEITDWTRTLEQKVEEKTEELKRAQANLIHVEKMASLGKLAATVAHELNNPLEGVLTYAKLLKKRLHGGDLTPEQRAEVQSELTLIADETARCGAIVKNLLLFSRQKVGKFQIEDLRSIIERSLKLIDHHLDIHQIRLELRLGDRPVPVECDPQQIEQALLALQINAVEAMPDGGTLTIRLEPNEASGLITMVLADTGIGIRSEELPRIFEPFYTTKEEGKGTGLGLSVVYGIIERHNGTITVSSQPGQGTSFNVTLPFRALEHGDHAA